MARSIGEAFMELGVRDAKFNAGLSRAGERVVQFGAAAGRIAARAAAALGVAAGAFAVFAIKVAADAEEAASKFDVVFGGAAAAARKEIDSFAKATGRSSVELQSLAGDTGDVIKALGFNEAKAKELSVALVKLGVDTASFKNKSEPDVLLAFKSALVGEREALKSLGVVILEADVKQEAFRKGLIKQGQALTPQIKALATFSLLQTKLADAQGDAERTAGSLTNRFRALKGAFTDMSADVGALIIKETGLANIVKKVTEAIANNADAIKNSVGNFIELSKVIASGIGLTLIDMIKLFKQFGLGAKLAAKEAEIAFAKKLPKVLPAVKKGLISIAAVKLLKLRTDMKLFGLDVAVVDRQIAKLGVSLAGTADESDIDKLNKQANELAQRLKQAGIDAENAKAKILNLFLPPPPPPAEDPAKPVKDIGVAAEEAAKKVEKLNKAMFKTVGLAGIAAARQALITGERKRPAMRPPIPGAQVKIPPGAMPLPQFQPFPPRLEVPPSMRIPVGELPALPEPLRTGEDIEALIKAIDDASEEEVKALLPALAPLNDELKTVEGIREGVKRTNTLLERVILAIDDRGVFV